MRLFLLPNLICFFAVVKRFCVLSHEFLYVCGSRSVNDFRVNARDEFDPKFVFFMESVKIYLRYKTKSVIIVNFLSL